MNSDTSHQAPMPESGGLTYRESGVDIDRARLAKQRVRQLAQSTFNSQTIGGIGSFAGLFRPDLSNVPHPVLVSTADGVGTKLKVAFLTGVHNTVGVDLVSHCTNDLMAQRGFPLFFLDYIGMGNLRPEAVEQIVEGLARGCRECDCVLLGGETAEMPDFYREGEYDLAGFMVGIADEFKLFDPERVKKGDLLIGLPSSGLHTNGFSLVRRLFFQREGLKVDSFVPELKKTVGEELLTIHRNYFPALRGLLWADDLHGLAHITGGGITHNLVRVLPPGVDAVVRRGTWDILPIFRYIRERGRVETDEMYRTFNMGLGMILVVAAERLERVKDHLSSCGERFYLVGEIVEGEGRVRYQ